MSDIIDIDKLTPDELAAVYRLIKKFNDRKGEEQVQERPRRNRNTNRDRNNRQPKLDREGRPTKAKRFSRTESVQLGKNKFLEMQERNSYKNDSKTDKALWKDREATPRPDKYNSVEVQCKICNRYDYIHPSLVLIDPDTKDINYTCDSCIGQGTE